MKKIFLGIFGALLFAFSANAEIDASKAENFIKD